MKNALIVEIFKDNETKDIRTIPPKGDRAEMKLYSQVAFVHLGGRFPVEFSLPLQEDETHYASGKYYLDQTSFKVGQFGRLEFERNITLIPVASNT
ncbi:G5P family DNA-binding protein [Vibrio maritimus]|uniref:G5P family DNA-binding protein n=1 Tax=Vibrio maritimus TaxID=990268 RepID=UPI001F45978E|nr:G5P family DNA-binding protein [Vibrio maritimus]